MFAGTTLALRLQATDPIEVIHTHIESIEGIARQQYWLTFGGKLLSCGGLSVQDYNIHGGRTLELMPRLKGGAGSGDLACRRGESSREAPFYSTTGQGRVPGVQSPSDSAAGAEDRGLDWFGVGPLVSTPGCEASSDDVFAGLNLESQHIDIEAYLELLDDVRAHGERGAREARMKADLKCMTVSHPEMAAMAAHNQALTGEQELEDQVLEICGIQWDLPATLRTVAPEELYCTELAGTAALDARIAVPDGSLPAAVKNTPRNQLIEGSGFDLLEVLYEGPSGTERATQQICLLQMTAHKMSGVKKDGTEPKPQSRYRLGYQGQPTGNVYDQRPLVYVLFLRGSHDGKGPWRPEAWACAHHGCCTGWCPPGKEHNWM